MRLLALILIVSTAASAEYTTKKLTATKAGYYDVNARYLVFNQTHPLASTINPALKSFATREQTSWLRDIGEMQKEMGRPPTPWELEIGMEVVWKSPKVISVLISRYSYSGGAHPNHGLEAMNFGMVNRKAKQLKLTDFFATGFDASAHVSKLLIAKLRKTEGADWVKDGNLNKLDAKMVQRFTASDKGLIWYFNPYDVGPYAAGDFEVTLNLRELGPKFKREMLLK